MSEYDGDALAGFDEFFGRVLSGLSPANSRKATLKLGRALRAANLERMKRNVEPDGAPMEKRKPWLDRRGRLRKAKGGKMFRKLRFARLWAVRARPDAVEVALTKAESTALVHHEGRRGFVGRGPDGKKIFTRFPRRRLLGFSPEDEQLALEIAEEMLNLDG